MGLQRTSNYYHCFDRLLCQHCMRRQRCCMDTLLNIAMCHAHGQALLQSLPATSQLPGFSDLWLRILRVLQVCTCSFLAAQ